jgi:flagellar FliJ protein
MHMTRAQRLQPVQTFVDDNERRRAEDLALAEQRTAACEKRLAELKQYEADYRRNYRDRVAAGMASLELRDFQAFLAKLGEAVRQQELIVLNSQAERDAQRKHWQDAARRAKAIEHVMDNWQAEDRRAADRRDQRDSDERAQRKHPRSHD